MGTTTAPAGCLIDGCTRTLYVRKMCSPHYRRWARGEFILPGEHRATASMSGSTEWMTDALCRSVDPEIFFPISEHPTCDAVRLARSICSTCPVREPCLGWALTNQPYGIAGGYTTDERTALRKAAAATPTATYAEIGAS